MAISRQVQAETTRIIPQLGDFPKLTLIKPAEQQMLERWWYETRNVIQEQMNGLRDEIDKLKAKK